METEGRDVLCLNAHSQSVAEVMVGPQVFSTSKTVLNYTVLLLGPLCGVESISPFCSHLRLRATVGGHYWLSHWVWRGLSERMSGKVLCRLYSLTEMSLLIGLLQMGCLRCWVEAQTLQGDNAMRAIG